MELALNLDKRYTYADYLTWMDDVRRELIEGFIKLLPAPRAAHAKVGHRISWQLETIIRKNSCRCEVFPAPFDVRLPKNGERADDKIYTVVQPDISVVCDTSKIDEYGCCGAPDMIVEILSPSTFKRDLHEKFTLYESSGVKEYWVVHHKDMTVQAFLLQENGKYDDGTLYERKGKVPVHIFNGCTIDLEDIFGNLTC
jgi:Uma2 family endonuclease